MNENFAFNTATKAFIFAEKIYQSLGLVCTCKYKQSNSDRWTIDVWFTNKKEYKELKLEVYRIENQIKSAP